MDNIKKSDFVRASRQKFAKGGRVKALAKRKYFADGGDTSGLILAGDPDTSLSGSNSRGTDATAANPNTGPMGTVNGWLGLNDNYQAGSANLQAGTNAAQLNNSYDAVQAGMGQQQGLVNQLNPQVKGAVANQQMLAQQYAQMAQGQGPNPAQNQLAQATAANVGNQNALMAGQRGAQGNVGLMARQAAMQGANTQQQSAGQAATLGAQQQIAAQQNLAGLSNNQVNQAGQATTGLNSMQQNEQALLQNANTSYNNANVGMQSNINNVNSQTAAANQNMNANILGGISSMASALGAHGGQVTPQGFQTPKSEQPTHHMLAEMNARSLKHFADGGEADLGTFKADDNSASAPSVPTTASLPAMPSMAGSGGGGGGGGGGGMMSLMALMADGGQIQPNPLIQPNGMGGMAAAGPGFSASAGSASSGPQVQGTAALPHNSESFSKDVEAMTDKKEDPPQNSTNQTDEEAQQGYLDADRALGANNQQITTSGPDEGPGNLEFAAKGGPIQGPHQSHVANFLAQGGKVPAMVSAGEVYLSPDQVNKVVNEDVDPAKIGHKFKGKAKVKGDSYANDTIPATLESGGIVVDRDHMGSADKRKLFVHKTVAKKRAGG